MNITLIFLSLLTGIVLYLVLIFRSKTCSYFISQRNLLGSSKTCDFCLERAAHIIVLKESFSESFKHEAVLVSGNKIFCCTACLSLAQKATTQDVDIPASRELRRLFEEAKRIEKRQK